MVFTGKYIERCDSSGGHRWQPEICDGKIEIKMGIDDSEGAVWGVEGHTTHGQQRKEQLFRYLSEALNIDVDGLPWIGLSYRLCGADFQKYNFCACLCLFIRSLRRSFCRSLPPCSAAMSLTTTRHIHNDDTFDEAKMAIHVARHNRLQQHLPYWWLPSPFDEPRQSTSHRLLD